MILSLNKAFLKNILIGPLVIKNLDKSHCIITISQSNFIQLIYFEFIPEISHKSCMIYFYAKSANIICHLLGSHEYLSSAISLRHSLYLGKELHKAEIALILGQKYIQD
nr:hypothetical protein Ahn.fas.Kor.pt_013 [Ahnfeltia fastigiata]